MMDTIKVGAKLEYYFSDEYQVTMEKQKEQLHKFNKQLDEFNRKLMLWNLEYVNEGLYNALLKQFDGDEEKVMEIGNLILHSK